MKNDAKRVVGLPLTWTNQRGYYEVSKCIGR